MLAHMDDRIRAYDEDVDLDAVLRIWNEIGWLDGADKKAALKTALAAGNTEVGVLDDEAECMVTWAPGSIRYQTTDVPMCVVTAVTTSHVGRRQGFASQMTTRALSQGADAGCAVAVLGMFDQGFYDKLGFGTAAYDHRLSFDPASLMVDHVPFRPPTRITMDEWADMHSALTNRMLSHGSVVIDPPEVVQAEVAFGDNPFALGYRDDDGKLTHFIYGQMKAAYGPWHIDALAYQNTDQLLELLRLLRELSDQCRSVRIMEPPDIQLQTMLKYPMRESDRSNRSDHESLNRSMAWWQLRMLDVEACVAARHWMGERVQFNLALTDPIENRLDGTWQGVGGDYTITVGADSRASRGHTDGLPIMRTGVGPFTRLWFGVRSPSVVAVSDEVDAPRELLVALDDALLLPKPVPGWAF